MSKPKAIIVDLDSTLCDASPRMHHLEGEKKNWPAFNAAHVDDTPNEWCVGLILAMKASNYKIVFVTGRSLDYYDSTCGWIDYHVMKGFPFELYMRPEKDFKPATEVKRILYQTHIAERLEVVFCVEDSAQIVAMWRDLGLVCLDCAGGEY